MIYEVSAAEAPRLRLGESDTVTSVLQNVAVILSTPKGTAPMYRDFGVDMSYVDLPIPAAQVRMIAAVREAVETWEPRAAVKAVRFVGADLERGVLTPVVEVEIRDAQQ